MQITSCEIANSKYIQIYLTEEELEKQETKELIKRYKKEKCSVATFVTGKENLGIILFTSYECSVATFVTGKENYPEVLKKIVIKQKELNKNVC